MDFLSEKIIDGLNKSLNGATDILDELSGLLTQSPDTFNSTVWNAVKVISDNAVLPIAYIILAFFAMTEMYAITDKYNNNHMILYEEPFKLVIKLFIGKALIDKTFDILLAIFELVGRIVSSANNSISVITRSPIDVNALMTDIEGMKFLDKIVIWLSLGPQQLILWVMNILIMVLVYGRFIEIYVYTAVARIPLSFVMYKSLGSIGKNFLKNFAAVALQGVFYIIIVGMYTALLANASQGGDVDAAMNNATIMGGVLIYALFKSSSWAKNVLGG